jgi:seryl-tRNA synthetase
MENPHISDEIGSGYASGNTWNTQDDFKGMGNSKVDSLKELVSEINTLIKEREKLSQDFIKEGDKMKRDLNNFLLENAPKGEDDSEFARERAELRKKQVDLSEIQLNERIGCWRDVALLKKELRDKEQELTEKEGRAQMLGRILED